MVDSPDNRALPWAAFLVSSLLALPLSGAEPVPLSPAPTEEAILRATLPNGLRVIIVRNALAPVVATSVNYLVGSDDAPRGFPGMAHAQEHMMFRGSPGLTAEQLANIGSIMGGDFNANTRESLTQYLYTVPANDLDLALHIEAVRMRGVMDSAEGWRAERGAIEQEVAQDLSNPEYLLYKKLRAVAFAGTPYAHDALGTRPSFDLTTAQMLRRFHDAWYAPNNAILVVVGNLDLSRTMAAVRRLFGDIPRKTLPAHPRIRLQPMAAASFTVPTDQPYATQLIAMRTPGLDSPDFPALEVLADVLNSHRFDLYGLVPQGKAIDAEFALDPLPQAGLSYASVSYTVGPDPREIEQRVRAILARVASEGVPADLVRAAKLQERRETEFQKTSIAGLASVWSDAVALYGLRSPDEDLVRIDKVTVEDVNRVARRYLDLSRAVSAVMLPQGSSRPVASGGGFGGQENISLGEAQPTTLPPWAESAVGRLTVPRLTTHPVVRQLANGLTLIIQPEDLSSTVSVFGHIRNRPETETPSGKEGVDRLLGLLLPFGSQRLDRLAFQRALDDIGAQEHAGTDFSVRALAENFDRAVQLLADNELHPALPPAAFNIEQNQLLQIIAARNESPNFLAQHALRAALYPADDPSARFATPGAVRSLTADDVRAYYHNVYRPDLTTIVVIGHVTVAEAVAAVSRSFGEWTATGQLPQTELPPAPVNRPSVISVPDAARVQDQVVLAQTLGLNRSDPQYYALELGSVLLGGGFYSTRLSIELRKKLGLVYSVGSELQAGRTRAVYLIQYASDPQNVAKAAAIAISELKNMQAAQVSSDELARAKALMLRRIPLQEASVDAIARGFIERRELNLPLDEPIRAAQRYLDLGAGDVQAAFSKWMRPDDMVRVSEGPTPPGQ